MGMMEDPVTGEHVRIHLPRKPRYALETAISGQFRARNESTDAVPPLDRVERIYLLTWLRDKAVVIRHGAPGAPWEIPVAVLGGGTADVGDTAPPAPAKGGAKDLDTWIKHLTSDLWQIRIRSWYQASRLALTANHDAQDATPGSVRYWLFLCATASHLDDLPDDADWARRSIIRREFTQLLRSHYAEFNDILNAAHDGYLIRQAQG